MDKIKEGVNIMQTILIVLDSCELENPDLDICYELPDKLEKYTNNEMVDNGYDYLADTEIGIWMQTQSAKEDLKKVVDFFEDHMVCGNDLSSAAKVYISEKEAAMREECTLVYDGTEMVSDESVRESNRLQKIYKTVLKIAGLITDENIEVIKELENSEVMHQDMEEQWETTTEVLIKSKYVCECDEEKERNDFLKMVEETVIVKENKLSIIKNNLDEDGGFLEWCEALEEQWQDMGYCMTVYERENANEVVFPCKVENVEEITELGKELCINIVTVADY